jgi:hypothetical protein
VPEPIQSRGNTVQSYDATDEPRGAVGAAAAATAPPIASSSSAIPLEHSPSVLRLVTSHSLLPKPSAECVDQAGDAIKSASVLATAAAGLLASGTIVPVVAFIGASAAFAASLAKYTNCEEATESRAPAKPK